MDARSVGYPFGQVEACGARASMSGMLTLRGVHLPPSTFAPIDEAISRTALAISHAVADRTNMLAAAYFLETDEPFEIVTEQRPENWAWVYPRNCSGARLPIHPADAIEPAARFERECPGCPASMMRLAYRFEGLTFVLRFEAREPE